MLSRFSAAARLARLAFTPALRSFASTPISKAEEAESPAAPAPKKAARGISSLKEGTKMEGLSVLKDKEDPVAMADDKYPDWLWKLLDDPAAAKAKEGAKEGEFDFHAERKRLRTQNRTNIRAANFLKTT
ncbi:60S ribosomal protein l37 [Trichosporon asahii var. asahii CBS 8904]|uniref:Large ribosomal subunit protein mL54 n=1 Tax=Trichosporon asahii var. asahii (strain CBS 8904) TaxID=1220162 RepID=K1VLW9_TRIAC|nr:60S ribosomal protein l37 [Trichosporon asahii var. asahii CBS 8904]